MSLCVEAVSVSVVLGILAGGGEFCEGGGRRNSAKLSHLCNYAYAKHLHCWLPWNQTSTISHILTHRQCNRRLISTKRLVSRSLIPVGETLLGNHLVRSE